MNIEELLSNVPHVHPVVTAFGQDKDSLTDFIVFAERGTMIHTSTLAMALHCAFSMYYIFDIAFPKNARNELQFLEKVVYELKPSMNLNTTLTVTIDSILKVST